MICSFLDCHLSHCKSPAEVLPDSLLWKDLIILCSDASCPRLFNKKKCDSLQWNTNKSQMRQKCGQVSPVPRTTQLYKPRSPLIYKRHRRWKWKIPTTAWRVKKPRDNSSSSFMSSFSGFWTKRKIISWSNSFRIAAMVPRWQSCWDTHMLSVVYWSVACIWAKLTTRKSFVGRKRLSQQLLSWKIVISWTRC